MSTYVLLREKNIDSNTATESQCPEMRRWNPVFVMSCGLQVVRANWSVHTVRCPVLSPASLADWNACLGVFMCKSVFTQIVHRHVSRVFLCSPLTIISPRPLLRLMMVVHHLFYSHHGHGSSTTTTIRPGQLSVKIQITTQRTN